MNALARNLADQELARGLAESILGKSLGSDWDTLAVRLRDQVIHELETEACDLERKIESEDEDSAKESKRATLYFLTLLEKRTGKSFSIALYEILITSEIMGSDKILEYLSMPEVKLSAEALVDVLIYAIMRLNEPVVRELIKYATIARTYNVYNLECYLPAFYHDMYYDKVRRITEIIEQWRDRILTSQRELLSHFGDGGGRI
jgi:hypothetical protein